MTAQEIVDEQLRLMARGDAGSVLLEGLLRTLAAYEPEGVEDVAVEPLVEGADGV